MTAISLSRNSAIPRLVYYFFLLFSFFFIISFPFPHQYIPDTGTMLAPVFEAPVKWIGETLFGFNKSSFTTELLSDSTGLYINALFIAILSWIGSVIITFSTSPGIDEKMRRFGEILVAYYLAMALINYGFNKVFKWQFFLPEPNTLFTTLGEVPKDLLFWSAIGSSRAFTMFGGILEVIAGSLLLFQRTRLAGGILAAGIMTQVVMINFSFDISVKVYSCFLLLLAMMVIAPDLKRLIDFFFLHRLVPGVVKTERFSSAKQKQLYVLAKFVVIVMLFIDSLSMYIISGNYNDDTAARPLFHGAYSITGETQSRWKKVFIHRRGYFIAQSLNEEMIDYKLNYDTLSNQIILINNDTGAESVLHYEEQNGVLVSLRGTLDNDQFDVGLNKIDLKNLPLIRHEFHWTIDSY
jgi:hypothetical protein